MDKLYEACQDLKGKAIQVFDSCMEGDCKVNGVGNGRGVGLSLYLLSYSFLLGLPTQAFFIYKLMIGP